MFSEFRQADDLHHHRDPIKIDLELNLHCKEANSNVPAAAHHHYALCTVMLSKSLLKSRLEPMNRIEHMFPHVSIMMPSFECSFILLKL